MGIKVKVGMKGSNSGRSRCEGTEVLRKVSKRKRRAEDKKLIKEQLEK